MTHAFFQPDALAAACEKAMVSQQTPPLNVSRIRAILSIAKASVKAATEFGMTPQSMALSIDDYELLRDHL